MYLFRFLYENVSVFKFFLQIKSRLRKFLLFFILKTYLLILIRFTTFTTMNLLAYDKVNHVTRYSYLIGCLPVLREARTHSCSLKCR